MEFLLVLKLFSLAFYLIGMVLFVHKASAVNATFANGVTGAVLSLVLVLIWPVTVFLIMLFVPTKKL